MNEKINCLGKTTEWVGHWTGIQIETSIPSPLPFYEVPKSVFKTILILSAWIMTCSLKDFLHASILEDLPVRYLVELYFYMIIKCTVPVYVLHCIWYAKKHWDHREKEEAGRNRMKAHTGDARQLQLGELYLDQKMA